MNASGSVLFSATLGVVLGFTIEMIAQWQLSAAVAPGAVALALLIGIVLLEAAMFATCLIGAIMDERMAYWLPVVMVPLMMGSFVGYVLPFLSWILPRISIAIA